MKTLNEFQITKHGRERILKRLNCREDKVEKVTIKAWRNKDKIGEKMMRRLDKLKFEKYENKKLVYKYFNGYIFVFDLRKSVKSNFIIKVLITIYHPHSVR